MSKLASDHGKGPINCKHDREFLADNIMGSMMMQQSFKQVILRYSLNTALAQINLILLPTLDEEAEVGYGHEVYKN